ncbi:MAG TPA: protein-disulfide reductase DsbD [Candidatus Saccharimonadia bacterium]|nr:protein-disulfide reductase DsbD [Candidatus Saccharimonadia bacterium]
MTRSLLRFTRSLAFALGAVAPAAFAIDESELLPVDEAFALEARAISRDTVELSWKIAEGYYLYRHRISAAATDAAIVLAPIALPPGKKKVDEFFGEVETYRGAVVATVQVESPIAGDRLELKVKSQGCADVGVCYPPHAQTVTVELPPAAAPATGALSPGAQPSSSTVAFGGSVEQSPFSAAPTAGATDELPLPPEQAFRFEAIGTAPDRVLARFTMPKGYYLYRDRTTFTATGGTLGKAAWPPGVAHRDEHFGDVVVYFEQVEVPIAVSGATAAFALVANFQGCQLDGICYPPMDRRVAVALPVAGNGEGSTSAVASPSGLRPLLQEASAPAPAADGEISEQDMLAAALSGPDRLATLLLFFGMGVLLAFTPCVLPMVPILSGIIAGAGENIGARRAFVLSCVYVLASSVVFTIAGVVAGLAGQNLQAAFQNPWVLSAFALVFVALAFSMFGFYELQLPAGLQSRLASWSNRQRGGSLAGVAVMGALSALIVGPCVAPPLAAAVIVIAEQRDAWLGGSALFALSLGMGAPLVAFGTGAGKLVPRAGAWMDAIKRVFGVMFLLLAVWMLERFLDVRWIMLMLAAIAIGSAVFLGALERLPDAASGWRRTFKALGILLLALGLAQLIGALGGARDYLQPLRGVFGAGAGAAHVEAPFVTIKSVADVERQIAAADKPVLLDFYADWCVSCKEMEKYTFPDPAVQRELARYVLLKADVTANDETDRALMQRYGIIGPPATLFFGADDTEQRALRLIGFEAAEPFAQRLERGAAR